MNHPSNPPENHPAGTGVPLAQLGVGRCGVVNGSSLGASERRLLSAMGLRERATVMLCRLGEPCIVRVMSGCGCSSRIGLARPLADKVFVTPAPGEPGAGRPGSGGR